MMEKTYKSWPHLMIWIFMGAYLFAAPSVYAQYLLSSGRPIKLPGVEQSIVTNKISSYIDGLDLTVSDGKNFYNLFGWAFFRGDLSEPQNQFERFISLESDDYVYSFPVESVKRNDVQKVFKDLQMDLQLSGFSTKIGKEFIKPGNYRISLIFRDTLSEKIYKFSTNRIIVRTINTFYLAQDSSD